ncbi:MAG: cell division protein ZipA C-terminal FtsZ-binding domain-containing protein [Gammaproteobacteria bacterium]|nr:cell division protein ZipA C-terminal FtsZ-binding domain-containing protein [Gammaproteobacteria bacterium]MCP5425219.1 cell division protein ZipA C-terminal FtsZ-binding domain-containing protein [Gammaproteobacteria bacterium]MCP5459627.1 cell division protein ZipA C-terminal FtsZ-binding domain-containing protein [Gammaproteobacteria bacterium]
MDKTRWILAILGAIVIALIYLWGMRARIREELRRRRRARQAENEPFLEIDTPPEEENPEPADAGYYGFDKFGKISPDHPLAKQILVDVEITPVKRAHGETEEDFEHARMPAAESFPPDISEENPEAVAPPAVRNDTQSDSRAVTTETLWQENTDLETEQPTSDPPSAPSISRPLPKEPGVQNDCKMTVLLTIIAHPRQFFEGSKILVAARSLGMQPHESGVIDCFADDERDSDKPVFSIAHLREPGTFDEATIETLVTPGLLLLMHLPGPLEPSAALDFMLDHTQQLNEALGGTICDESRNRMTNQRLGYLRREIIEFDRQLRLQKPRY